MVSFPLTLTGIVDGQVGDAVDWTTPFNETRTYLENLANGDQAFKQLNYGAASEVTISGGAITITASRHRVDTEGNSVADDLDTIIGGSDGDVLRLQLENASRSVTLRNSGGGSGNIRTADGSDIKLSSSNTFVDLTYDATNEIWMASVATSAIERNLSGLLIAKTNFSSVSTETISIPSNTFDVLDLTAMIKKTTSGVTSLTLKFNGDSASYIDQYTLFDPSLVPINTGGSGLSAGVGINVLGSNASSESFSLFRLTVYNVQLNLYKNYSYFGQTQSGGVANEITRGGGVWRNTDPINSISLILSAGNFDNNSWYAITGSRLF
jgi:hypothetical protein